MISTEPGLWQTRLDRYLAMVAVTHFDGFLETSYFDVQCCSFLFGLITLVLGLGQVQPQDVALFTDLKKTNEEIKVLISISNKSIKIHVYVFFNKHLWKLHQPIWLVSSIFIGTNNKEYKYFSTIVSPKRIIFNTDDNFMDQLSNQLNIGIQWKWNHSKFLLSYNT